MDVYRQVIDKLPPAGLASLLGLGEPLLHPSIFEMIRLAGRDSREVSITTNALTIDPRCCTRLLDSGLDFLRISVDQVGDACSGPAHHRFSAKALRNTELMVRERGRATRPHIMLNTVVTNENKEHVPHVIRWARESGVDAVNLIKLARNTPHVRRIPPDEEADRFESYHALGEHLGLELRSNYPLRHLRFDYCPLYYNYLYINLHGQVTPCCHMPEPRSAVGNLLEQNLDQIWSGKALRRFWANAPDICGDCTLMVWRSGQIIPPKPDRLLSRLFG
jgi:radical SAM protein with 4Fe4S-binding SPASM domain